MEKERCKKKIWQGWRYTQCSRNAWKDGFCKQHHPESVQAREEKSQAAWKAKQNNSPWAHLARAQERIKELEIENQNLKEFINEKDKI
jgi:hypothetical protein